MLARTMMAAVFGVLLLAPSVNGATDPYLQPDETWISMSGTVVSPDEDSFRLDFGDGTIVVEMDDWDDHGDAIGLKDGDRVTVYGCIDSGLYERTTIEAGNVYVERLNTHFYANASDEEGDGGSFWNVPVTTVVSSAANLRGTVSAVHPDEGTFILNTGEMAITVDTKGLTYNPLDEYGYQQIDSGDLVSVSGYLTTDFFTGREFRAETVITLANASDS